MKKILTIILCVFFNIRANSINHELNEAIRSSDLKKVSLLVRDLIFSEKEKKAYLDLADEYIDIRLAYMHLEKCNHFEEEYVPYNEMKSCFNFSLFSFAVAIMSGRFGRTQRLVPALACGALFLAKGVHYKYICEKATQEILSKRKQLHKNAQEIKQLILMN